MQDYVLKNILNYEKIIIPHYLLVSVYPIIDWAEEQLKEFFHNLGVRAGITRNVFPHITRHGTATTLLNSGVPIHIVASYLGHSDINTTKLYIKINKEEVRMSCQTHLN